MPPPIAEVQPLLDRLHTFVESADRQGFLTLLSPESDLDAAGDFAAEALSDNVTRAVVRPRLLVPKGDSPDVDTNPLEVLLFLYTPQPIFVDDLNFPGGVDWIDP